ncbi:hypothetical protein OIU79_015659, partial [Salix purpurea]
MAGRIAGSLVVQRIAILNTLTASSSKDSGIPESNMLSTLSLVFNLLLIQSTMSLLSPNSGSVCIPVF